MKRLLLIVGVGLTLVSCKADPLESGPDKEFLRSRLATELPAYIRLPELRIEASQK